MLFRDEPGYLDQMPRRLAYEASHPAAEIVYAGTYWQAVITEENGQVIVTRYDLKSLLDKLEALDRER